MSGEDLVNAAKRGEFDEVVRYVDEEHVDVNYEHRVSFPFLRNLNHFFLFLGALCENRIEIQLSPLLVKKVISKLLTSWFQEELILRSKMK